MKKKLSKKVIKIAIYSAFLSTGFVVGKIFSVSYFSIDTKINIIDVLSILTTLFAAYVLSTVIDKEKEDHRTEKDLILKRIEDIYQLIEDTNLKLTASTVPYQVAASKIKRIYISLKT